MAGLLLSTRRFLGGILSRFAFWILGILIPVYDLYLKPILPPDRRPELGVAGDLGPLILIAGVTVAATLSYHELRLENTRLLAASHVARTAKDTQRHLGSVSHAGQQLLGRLNSYAAYEGDEAADQFWKGQVQIWTDWADRMIDWRLPHLREAFANDAGRDASDYSGTKWQRDLQTWMGVRMQRLNEFTLDAQRLQAELGPEPPDDLKSPPPVVEPPAPIGGMVWGSVRR